MSQDEAKVTFSFGENWYEYVKAHFSQERVTLARDHLAGFLGTEDLKGLDFVDVGCGSGIHSLAAMQLGAERTVSFDLDPMSVRAATQVREKIGSPENWTIMEGSALDPEFLAGLGQFDVVYSWGVLHHTGRMWEAVRNAATLVKPGGRFYIALYTTDYKSGYWLKTKQKYNAASAPMKRLMEARYALKGTFIPLLLQRRSPFKYLKEYRGRGMSFYTDVKDWLGGLPYEHAKPEEVLRFGRTELGMELINLATGEGCSEYLFRKPPQ